MFTKTRSNGLFLIVAAVFAASVALPALADSETLFVCNKKLSPSGAFKKDELPLYHIYFERENNQIKGTVVEVTSSGFQYVEYQVPCQDVKMNSVFAKARTATMLTCDQMTPVGVNRITLAAGAKHGMATYHRLMDQEDLEIASVPCLSTQGN